jgi:simple sugar transport system ATP-binding protein/ribose transport system ATP-binding protein
MSVAQNIQLGSLSLGANPVAILSPREAQGLAETWTRKLEVRAISPSAKVVELSGGNQQKVVIAKAAVQRPKLIIFDEPTRGVDVGAIAEIHRFINELADSGIAVVVISSYLPEILALSDRILVARQGRIVEELPLSEATEERIMFAAVH